MLLEKVLPAEPGAVYPRCLAGERACPPEDCGGTWGYLEFLEAMSNPNHPDHKDMREWIGGSFDPERFDLEATDRRLKGLSKQVSRPAAKSRKRTAPPPENTELTRILSEVNASLMGHPVPAPRPAYTRKQGQYLAFIHYYTKLHGTPPAEAEMARYFGVSAPSAHQMVVTLEENGFIARTRGRARSIRLLLSRESLPDLE